MSVGLSLAAAASSVPVSAAQASVGTQFYVRHPDVAAVEQIAHLRQRDPGDADALRWMLNMPQAIWLTGGSPQQVRGQVRQVVREAADRGTVPVLVAYNIPFRDCSQYSGGGATSMAAYRAWIDAFAAGIGRGRAIVILEPDGLGIIPWYRPIGAAHDEWCQPAAADPATAASDRFAMLNHAVDVLRAHPGVSVYLDGTHSAWLGVGDIADRLVRAGVEHANGFFLNVSNFQYTANLVQYGTWISDCIAYAAGVERGDFAGCPDQSWNGGPEGTKIAQLLGARTGVTLSNDGEWSDASDAPGLNTSGINARYAAMLGTVKAATHFVIDTSRNGAGPWTAPPRHPAGDPQDWCNPPDRGLGLRPTVDTGVPLLDAYLWIKTPGESDGQCYRWTSGPLDPVRNMGDPAAGHWFAEMALELVHNANPPLSGASATPPR